MSNNLKEGEVLTAEQMAQELTQTRRVDAVESGRPFFTVNKDLKTEIAGHTKLIDFDNGAAKGLVFIAPDGKQYSLGNPSRRQTHHTIISHPQIIQPVVDAGFEPMDIVHNRGGVGLFALFRHPEIVMPDQITWDHENYGSFGYSSHDGDSGLLHLSVAMWLDARTGKSIRAAVGFFRNICSNGLVSTILGMGSLRITHNSFSKPKIDQFAETAINNGIGLEFQTFSPRVLEWPLGILDNYQRDQDGTLANLPAFARKPFNTALASQPNWFQDEIMYQMNLALESNHELSTLDVLNLITNVNRAAESDSTMFRVESISEAFVSLLEVSAFRQGIEFPDIVTVNHANT